MWGSSASPTTTMPEQQKTWGRAEILPELISHSQPNPTLRPRPRTPIAGGREERATAEAAKNVSGIWQKRGILVWRRGRWLAGLATPWITKEKEEKALPFPEKKEHMKKKSCDEKKCCTNVTKMGRHFCCNDAVYFEKKVEAIFVLSLKYVHLIHGVIRFPEFRARISS